MYGSKGWRFGAWLLALTLLAAGCLPRGVRIPQSPLLRTLERKSGLIAYVGTDGNIYTVNQGGGDQRAVTDDAHLPEGGGGEARYYQFPTWSPDGERLAFVGVSSSDGSVETASLYTVARDGTELVEAFASDKEVPVYLYWSPEGKHLSFLSAAEARAALALQIVPARRGEARILDAGEPYYWAWAPDGQSMLVHVGGAARFQPKARLAFLSLNGEVVEEGLSLRPTLFHAPAWSPDGQRTLMAVETDDGNRALLVADRRGVMDKVLTTFDGSIAFGWSPDGERVAYITGDGGSQGTLGPLTVLDPDKPFEARVTEDTQAIAFFWSPDSRKIAYFVPSLFSPTPEPGQTEPSEEDQVLLLSLHTLDVKRGESQLLTTFRPTDEFFGILPYFDQYQHSATIWSPDSRNLVLSTYSRQGDPALWIVTASGKLEPRHLTEGLMAAWSWE